MVSKGGLALVAIGGALAAVTAYTLVKTVSAKGGGLTATVQVVDQNNNPLPGASVTLGASLPQTTDSAGLATFTGFPSGTYQIIVTDTGFQSFTETINLIQNSTYPVQLVPNATCTPQVCNPGYWWNPTVCSCVKQQVGSIIGVPSVAVLQNWYAHINVGPLGNTILCIGVTPSGDPGNCGTCGANPAGIQVAVQVLDVNGNPMAGVPVDGFLSILQLPWQTSDGQTWGHFNLSLQFYGVRGPQYTDSNGVTTFTVLYEAVIDGTKGFVNQTCLSGACGLPACGPSLFNGLNFSVLFTAQVAGTSFKTATSVVMNSSLYVYYYA